MKFSPLFLFVVSFALQCDRISSYKILGFFPIPLKSHYFVGHSLMKGLADAGHDVTFISPFQETKPKLKNFNEIRLTGVEKSIAKSKLTVSSLEIERISRVFFFSNQRLAAWKIHLNSTIGSLLLNCWSCLKKAMPTRMQHFKIQNFKPFFRAMPNSMSSSLKFSWQMLFLVLAIISKHQLLASQHLVHLNGLVTWSGRRLFHRMCRTHSPRIQIEWHFSSEHTICCTT